MSRPGSSVADALKVSVLGKAGVPNVDVLLAGALVDGLAEGDSLAESTLSGAVATEFVAEGRPEKIALPVAVTSFGTLATYFPFSTFKQTTRGRRSSYDSVTYGA